MNRLIVIVASGLALAGCTSGGGMNLDWFPKFEPAPVQIQFQSEPAGAEAKTTAGTTCQTPCSLPMAADKDFQVTFTLAGYQPQTISVQPTKGDGETTFELTLQPNPVEVQLVPVPKTPPRRTPPRTSSNTGTPRPAAARPAAPRPAATAPQPAPASPAPAATDPWPPTR